MKATFDSNGSSLENFESKLSIVQMVEHIELVQPVSWTNFVAENFVCWQSPFVNYRPLDLNFDLNFDSNDD